MIDINSIKDVDANEIKKAIQSEIEEAFKNPQQIELLVGNVIQYSKKTNIFKKYSFNNVLLLMAQRKNLTELKTFNAWKKEGVKVTKGEKALYVLSPIPMCRTHNLDKDSCSTTCPNKYMIYKKQALFDATQTDLVESQIDEIVKKNFEDNLLHPEFSELVEYLKDVKSFDLQYNQSESGEAGWTNGEIISISLESDPELKFQTLLHEFGHLYLNHPKDNLGYEGHSRGVKETQAEMFAWISEKILELETEKSKIVASNYIKSWSSISKDINPVKEFTKVFNAVTKVFCVNTLTKELESVLEKHEHKKQYEQELNDEFEINSNERILN